MSTNNKKKYSKPVITAHAIDNEISLVMMTYTGEDPPPVPSSAANSADPTPTQLNNFNDNPFGE
ncbi:MULTISPECIES: hypothetical protein [unclassified Saccharicrinis]|uniref:hypothetical protein n=1 Tax=unclassified Saccharicrinis TaxID=2646859 RepID=UPI003D327335